MQNDLFGLVDKPRTSRWRGGVAFLEHWTNAKAAFIGYLIGRGYSTIAIAETLSDGTSDATVRNMARKWGLPHWGKKTDGYIIVPMREKERARIAARARQEGIGQEEWCRRFLISGSVERKTYGEVVRDDQFY